MKITIVGLGGGTPETLTIQAREALLGAGCIIGAKRLLASLPEGCTDNTAAAITAADILSAVQAYETQAGAGQNPAVAVVMSGDTGFYSGTKKLLPLLKENGYDTEVLPGLSSVQMLAARLGRTWQDWELVSAHGLDVKLPGAAMSGRPTFFLTDSTFTPAVIAQQLTAAGLGDLGFAVGEELSYSDEKITVTTAAEAAGMTFAPLSVALTDAIEKSPYRAGGLPDDLFIRGEVPMTKRDIRAAVLSRLAVKEDDVLWDIGAGTGSCSVEMALAAPRGAVCAVECVDEACGLIMQNRERFHVWNLALTQAKAPDGLADLPAPDAVFIGGTRGQLDGILDVAIAKNPAVRIVTTAIALESLQRAQEALSARGYELDITQIQVSHAKKAGSLHLMMAENPIYLIAAQRPVEE